MIQKRVSLIPLMLLLLPLVMSGMTIEVHAQIPTRSIAVSVSSLAGIVQEVVGSQYNTKVLWKQESDPHAFVADPEMLAIAEDADLLVFTGHLGWEKDIANQTSKPFITFHDIDALENYDEYGAEFSPMPGGGVQEDEDHDHEGNPHGFWLLPKNAIAIANATRWALTTLNTTMASEWDLNFAAFVDKMQELEDSIGSLNDIHSFSEMHAVVVSPAEAYVAETFGIICDAVLQVEQITISGPRLLEVQEAIRNGSINLIIGSDIARLQAGGEFAYQLQADYGGFLIWWKTVFYTEPDYFWMMNYNLGALVSGLEGRSGGSGDNTINIGLVALSSILGILLIIESGLLILRAQAE